MNKTVKFNAAGIYNTWSKTGYLFENGWFLSVYSFYNLPTLFAKEIVEGSEIWFQGYQKFEKAETVDLNFHTYLENLNSKGLLKNYPELSMELKKNSLKITDSSSDDSKLQLQKETLDFYTNEELNKILKQSRALGIVDVENKCIPNPTNVKYIVVGDNPGATELIEREYFIGYSGQLLRKLFERENLVSDFKKECIVFNKTVFSTPKTLGLEDVKSKLGSPVFDKVLQLSAQHVLDVQAKLNVPILIFGYSELQFGKLLYPFWEHLKNNCANDAILLFSHPSHGHFENEWIKNKSRFPSIKSKQLLELIGKENFKGFPRH